MNIETEILKELDQLKEKYSYDPELLEGIDDVRKVLLINIFQELVRKWKKGSNQNGSPRVEFTYYSIQAYLEPKYLYMRTFKFELIVSIQLRVDFALAEAKLGELLSQQEKPKFENKTPSGKLPTAPARQYIVPIANPPSKIPLWWWFELSFYI